MNFFMRSLKWVINFPRMCVRSIGWITKGELSNIQNRYKNEIAELKRQIESYSYKLNSCKENAVDPHDFDSLIPIYHPEQINALVYRVINDARNNPERSHYLKRWRSRIDNAINNPQYKSLETNKIGVSKSEHVQ